MWLERIDTKVRAVRQRESEMARGHHTRPQPPEWVVELGIGNGHPPVELHTGDCYAVGRRLRPVGHDEARRLLSEGLSDCSHCKPASRLGMD
jgi:hypothetical protein